MCIIVAKPIGIEVPSKYILRNCFTANRHGAGFMFNHDNKVYIYKGFMTFETFYQVFQKTVDKYDLKNKGVVIHFRISTGGRIDEGNCHPYPISSNDEDLRKLKIIVKDVAMAHNGIIRSFSDKSNYLNDTQMFIKEVVNAFYEVDKEFYLDKGAMDTLEIIAGSKLCFLDKNGELHMLGSFHKDGGIYYSNQTYKRYSSINTETHKRDNFPVFDDLYFQLDDIVNDNEGLIKNKEFENLLKKVSLLDKGEFVFSQNEDRVYEGGDRMHLYAYDDDLNLYEINNKEKNASLIEVDIKF